MIITQPCDLDLLFKSGPQVTVNGWLVGGLVKLHYIKSYLECPKSLGPLEHYMRLKEQYGSTVMRKNI